jgi:hypothetical protein
VRPADDPCHARERSRDTRIHDHDARVTLPCEHGCRRTPGGKVAHHLARDLCWVGAHTLRRDAVVGRDEEQRAPRDGRPLPPLDPSEPDAELFETSKTAGRFRQPRVAADRSLTGELISRPDARDRLVDQSHERPSST